MTSITTNYGTYQLTTCPDDGRYVDIDLAGRLVASRILRAEAAQWIADREAAIASAEAKKAAYEAQGMQIVRVRPTGAARYRRMAMVAVVKDGVELARYGSIAEVPELDTPAESEEIVEERIAQAVRPQAYRTPAVIEETRVDGYTLTDGGATQIFDHS